MEGYKVLLQAAATETGLDDFGSDSFLEGLEKLVNALRDEARLNPLGEAVLRGRIIGHLKQRLQVEDWYRRYPDIDEVPIAAPLIGIGLPRTGSTVLSCLLALDADTRSLRRWEAAQPCPPPATVTGPDPRIETDLAAQRATGLKSHVPSGAGAPAECLDLMALDFKSQIFQAFAQVPSYSDWLLAADHTSTYLYERRVLKLLQWGCPARPWRLKSPAHLAYLDQLDRAFPDARFVMTHREPADVMLSVAEVYADIAAKFTDHLDTHYLAQLNIHHWSEGMRRALAFRECGDHDERFYDIDFRAMQRDPVAAVRGLYRWLGEPVSEDFERGMAAWWRENSEDRESAPRRDAADYGIDLAQVRPLFADYSRRAMLWTQKRSSRNGD
ncbi:MAG: sulfotransferase [Gammaproteobacteria bacterium]|nr:sulfotransferase [Gammaproteobacteria bacterium]